jgi:hypothetical protein
MQPTVQWVLISFPGVKLLEHFKTVSKHADFKTCKASFFKQAECASVSKQKKLAPLQSRNYMKQEMAGCDFSCLTCDGDE